MEDFLRWIAGNEVAGIVATILFFAVGIFVVMLIRRGTRRVSDKIDRAISRKEAKAEDDLLQTTVIFTTNAPLSVVHKSVSDTVGELIASDFFLQLIMDSKEATGWQGVSLGQSKFQAQLTYSEKNGLSVCGFSIPHITKTSGVSNHVERMTKLRNSVIIAFQRIDPNVSIQTTKQKVDFKLNWI